MGTILFLYGSFSTAEFHACSDGQIGYIAENVAEGDAMRALVKSLRTQRLTRVKYAFVKTFCLAIWFESQSEFKAFQKDNSVAAVDKKYVIDAPGYEAF